MFKYLANLAKIYPWLSLGITITIALVIGAIIRKIFK